MAEARAARRAAAAVRRADHGAVRSAAARAAMNQPTVTPAANGTAHTTQYTGVPPPPGTAASRGNGGRNAPGAAAYSGAVVCPAPRTKPGPRA